MVVKSVFYIFPLIFDKGNNIKLQADTVQLLIQWCMSFQLNSFIQVDFKR